MTYLAMHRGDDRVLEVTASESLTGSALRFTAKRRRGDATPVIEKATGGEGIVIGDPDTTAEITIDAADTEEIAPGILRWDVEVVDATDKVHTVATGRLAILEDVTRAPEA